jgi:hypothetical protein
VLLEASSLNFGESKAVKGLGVVRAQPKNSWKFFSAPETSRVLNCAEPSFSKTSGEDLAAINKW